MALFRDHCREEAHMLLMPVELSEIMCMCSEWSLDLADDGASVSELESSCH